MDWGDFRCFKVQVRNRVDRHLQGILFGADMERPLGSKSESGNFVTVREAAWYAVRGGHRWRAMVAIAAGQIFSPDAMDTCLPVGAAIELAHAASLILDDLPSMDDGKLRRGRPCTHIRFSDTPWVVDMTPLYMVNLAYKVALENERTGYRERVESAWELSCTSHRMINGQELDVTQNMGNAHSINQRLVKCYEAKSGALYASAAKAGALTCGAGESEQDSLYTAGMEVGMAYQFMDDICDVTATSKESGKNPGQDAGSKQTAVDLFGVQGARSRAAAYQEAAIERLTDFGDNAETLRDIVRNATWAPA